MFMTNTELKNQIDADITNATGANSVTTGDVGNNMKAIVDYVDQKSHNNLILKLTQSGTSAPTVVEMYKDSYFDGYLVLRSGVGQYIIRCFDKMTNDKTICSVVQFNATIGGDKVFTGNLTTDDVRILTRNNSDSFADGILNNTIIKVTVIS